MASDDAPENCITWPNHGWFTEQSIALQGEVLANNDNGRSAAPTRSTSTPTR
jgi:sn-glycerol 3-phosphate transport system substrate-binding protein